MVHISSRLNVKKQLAIWRDTSNTTKNKETKSYHGLADRIARAEEFINERQRRIKDILKLTEHDIEVINGCFFYPSSYVEAVAKKIANESRHVDSYEDVLRVFEAPRNYLSGVNFFKV